MTYQRIVFTGEEDQVATGWSLLFNSFQFNYAETTALLTIIYFTVILAVVLRQQKALYRLTHLVPESGWLMILSLVCSMFYSAYFFSMKMEETPLVTINAEIIEYVLIPPIILHAAYELFHRKFFQQIGTILVLAVGATVLNMCFVIFGLWILYGVFYQNDWQDQPLNAATIATFAAIISAVDPVAVLAVFNEVNADEGLYYLVFGEALLNDGVTFVLFTSVRGLAEISAEEIAIPASSYVAVTLSFLTAPLGGILVGIFCGLAGAFISKYSNTSNDEREEPIIIILLGGFAYFLSNFFGFSGVLSIIAFGLTQERYTFANINPKASVVTTNIIEAMATISECFLFFILGSQVFSSLVRMYVKDQLAFCAVVLLLITVGRIIVTTSLCPFLNQSRPEAHQINWKWQILIVVGGLRGAIAYAMICTYRGPNADMFYDTIVVVIFCTTLFGGVLAKPLVKYLGLEAQVKRDQDAREADVVRECPSWLKFFEDHFVSKIFTSGKYAPHTAEWKELADEEEDRAFHVADGAEF